MRADIAVGAATCVLAILGGVVASRPPTSSKQMWSYIAAFVVLGISGFVFVVKQSKESAVTGQKLDAALGDIKRTADLNTDLQRQLIEANRQLAELSREIMSTTTGGDSFAYLFFTTSASNMLLPSAEQGICSHHSKRQVPALGVERAHDRSG